MHGLLFLGFVLTLHFPKVPGVGLEPTRHFWQGILSPQRLPIPPSGQMKEVI